MERARASCSFYAARGKEEAIAFVLRHANFEPEPNGGEPGECDIFDGEWYVHGSAPAGIPDMVGYELEKFGVPYVVYQWGSECPNGQIRMYTPELGNFTSYCDEGGAALIPAIDLDKVLDEAPGGRAELAAAIRIASGGPWELAHHRALTAPDHETEVYRTLRHDGLSPVDAELALRTMTEADES